MYRSNCYLAHNQKGLGRRVPVPVRLRTPSASRPEGREHQLAHIGPRELLPLVLLIPSLYARRSSVKTFAIDEEVAPALGASLVQPDLHRSNTTFATTPRFPALHFSRSGCNTHGNVIRKICKRRMRGLTAAMCHEKMSRAHAQPSRPDPRRQPVTGSDAFNRGQPCPFR